MADSVQQFSNNNIISPVILWKRRVNLKLNAKKAFLTVSGTEKCTL